MKVPHHHQWPSVIVYDRPVKSACNDGKGNLLAPKQQQAAMALLEAAPKI